jgi:hypothetical protein
VVARPIFDRLEQGSEFAFSTSGAVTNWKPRPLDSRRVWITPANVRA